MENDMIKHILAAAALVALTMSGVAVAADAPTDPQIAHIAYTAGAIDIKAADQALALVKKLGVTPEDNPVSQSLTKSADEEAAKLAKLDGAAFDKAYIANEVAYHKAVNAALKDTLIPAAQNPELKALLEQGLTLFTEHQHHAEMIAGELK
jgi:putative membrane protein